MKAKIICLTQHKGGTTKTSSTINIAASLVNQGYKVLTCDLDSQSNLTIGLGVDPTILGNRGMKDLLTEPKSQAEDFVVATEEGIDLLPGGIELTKLDRAMPEYGREKVLAKKLHPLTQNYDFILIDTPPYLGLPTINGITAANYLLIPVQPEPFCIYGLSQLQETFEMIKEDANPKLEILGVFIAKLDKRLGLQSEIAEKIRNEWGELAFETIIYNRAKIQETQLQGCSIIKMEPNSPTAKEYKALTKEVLERAN